MLLSAAVETDILPSSPGDHQKRCLDKGVIRTYKQPVFQGQFAREKGQEDQCKSPRARDDLQSMSTAQRGD